jgi:hypothetical protein
VIYKKKMINQEMVLLWKRQLTFEGVLLAPIQTAVVD